MVIVLFWEITSALPPKVLNPSGKINYPATYDLTTFYDANRILMFTTNIGTVGMDHTFYFDRCEGLYYPYSGDTANIGAGIDNKTLIYSAGVVVVGKVDGQILSAVGMYEDPEFVPGPMAEAPLDSSLLRVFKIDTASGPGDFDYDYWPTGWGAPTDSLGLPLRRGSQTLYTVFNDKDSTVHGNIYGGGTGPLGIEIHLTAWGSNDSTTENILYLQYKIYNQGDNDIDSCFICFWADPDLGGPNDDLAGCDTLNNLFYCYNGYANDHVYGEIPPAWGGQVVYGPVVSSPGSTARFDRNLLADHRNIDMSAFSSYVNADAPFSPEELFLCACGLNCKTGELQVDPISGDSTNYFAPGNPLTAQGWNDNTPGDKKILVGFGPLTFNRGDSQIVELKLGAYQYENSLLSLSHLRNILDSTIEIDTLVDTTTYFAADSAIVLVEDFGLEKVTFTPPKSRWLTGYNWGGLYFSGGADYASEFFGSALNVEIFPDSFHNVEIRFSPGSTQMAYRYLRGIEPQYQYGGYYEVPFTVWDIDNDRQLNVAFVEFMGSAVFDSAWSLDSAADNGGYEFLFILNSDYSGPDPYNSFIPYPDYNLIDDVDSLDLLYFIWPVLRPGASMDNLKDGHALEIIGQFENINGPTDTIIFNNRGEGILDDRTISVRCYHDLPACLLLSVSDTTRFKLSTYILKYLDSLPQRFRVDFYPGTEENYHEYMTIKDSVSGFVLKTVNLIGGETTSTDVDEPDIPIALPTGFALHQNHPNPFNPSTDISFDLPRRGDVSLTIYNILGQKVITLVNKSLPVGRHEVSWDGIDASGYPVAAGIYFYRLQVNNFSKTRKMLLLK